MSANITLAIAITQRDLYLDASAAIAVGKAYTIGNRQLTRLDAQDVRDQITYWQRAIRSLESHAAGATAGSSNRIATWT